MIIGVAAIALTIVWLLGKGLAAALGVGVVAAVWSIRGQEIDRKRFISGIAGIQGLFVVIGYAARLMGAQQFPKIEGGPGHLVALAITAVLEAGIGYWAGMAVFRRVVRLCRPTAPTNV